MDYSNLQQILRNSPNSSFDEKLNRDDSFDSMKRKNSITVEDEPRHYENNGDHHQTLQRNNLETGPAGLTSLLDPINEFDHQVDMGCFLKGTEYDIFEQANVTHQ